MPEKPPAWLKEVVDAIRPPAQTTADHSSLPPSDDKYAVLADEVDGLGKANARLLEFVYDDSYVCLDGTGVA